MTPEEAREIERLEFEADCRAARERAFALIAERHGEERARVLRWMSSERPKERFNPKPTPKLIPTPLQATISVATPKQRRTQSGQLRYAFGMALTLRQWADHLGISLNTLHQRIHRSGSLTDAIAIGGLQPAHRPKAKPGVVMDLPAPTGTGGGPIAQEISEIEFSQ